MNDVQQALVRPHPQTNEHTWQGNTECWSLIVDEGLFQVDRTNRAMLNDNDNEVKMRLRDNNALPRTAVRGVGQEQVQR